VPKPIVVGIAGGSASGKTTIATALRGQLEAAGERVDVLATDPYMHHDLDRGPTFRAKATGALTFDCNQPESVDWAAVLRDLDERLTASDAVDVLLVEGMMVLQLDEVRERLDLRLFVELDADERALRRLLRDMSSTRGLDDPVEIAAYYLESAKVGHAQWVEPSRVHADLILRGDASIERIGPLLLAAVEQLRSAVPSS
jgi:uridine kinase